MADLAETLRQAKGRWMLGTSANEVVPDTWRDAVEGDVNPELALMAIAAQADLIALRRVPGGELSQPPQLPRLALPTLPEQHRARFRRIASSQGVGEPELKSVLHLLVARGWSVHPTDYMPRSFTGAPTLYGRWANWREGSKAEPVDALTAENWGNWWPAERRDALRQMREDSPDQARFLIETHAAALPAEQRLAVVETLAVSLGPDDVDYLQSLETDRSGKVRQLALSFLARLGETGDESENIAEFADYFSLGKRGLINRATTITSNKLKTNAQKVRRGELAKLVSLTGFASALGLDPIGLIDAWDGTQETTPLLVEIVAQTGSDQAVARLAARAGENDEFTPLILAPLAKRLTDTERREILPKILASDEETFSATRVWAETQFGSLSHADILSADGVQSLLRHAKPSQSDERHVKDHFLSTGLFSLGLLADQEAAQRIITTFTEAGLFATDPALGLLTFNAKLNSGETP
ncbi:MAG: DUF5691 domain-containing protein [Pseudomonadota bacterium]